MKTFFTLLFVSLLIACRAQETDLALRVTKAKPQYVISPEVDGLHRGISYDFIISGLKASVVSKASASFGTATFKPSTNGKDIELKLTVTDLNARSGTLTVSGSSGTVLLKREYKVIATLRYTDYSPSLPGAAPNPPVVLMLNKDTLADNGIITSNQLRLANNMTLADGKLSGFIRKNLMCRIRLVHDTITTTLHSSLDHLSDKVKQGLAKAVPGDKILIENMENLWIDAKRQDYITSYSSLSYELTVGP
ncbi:MAG: hypothetical protein JWO03_3289 [Bacteroidetes bacterium]|nr:hypothetical protein [Bacteroidota bacterium]